MSQFTLSSLVGGIVKNIAIIGPIAPATAIINPKNNSTDVSVYGYMQISQANQVTWAKTYTVELLIGA